MKNKSFRKIYNYAAITKEVVNLKFYLVSNESASVINPFLGQYQISINEFFDSYNKFVVSYNENLELIIKIKKVDNWFEFKVFSPKITFFVNSRLIHYGFNLNEIVYSVKFFPVEDLYFLVNYFSNKYFFSIFKSSKVVFGYFKSINNLKIFI